MERTLFGETDYAIKWNGYKWKDVKSIQNKDVSISVEDFHRLSCHDYDEVRGDLIVVMNDGAWLKQGFLSGWTLVRPPEVKPLKEKPGHAAVWDEKRVACDALDEELEERLENMFLSPEEVKMRQFKKLIDRSRSIVVLTGAGMSTESGLPDFRPITGLYKTATMVFSSWFFKLWPGRFYRVMGPFYKDLKEAKPNAGHVALAELEKRGKKVQIITQNVDGLHQEAGSTTVHEIHGRLGTMTCQKCGKSHSTADFTDTLTRGKTPKCSSCGGVLKPDLVFFGDALPEEPLRKAELAMLDADLVLVCGTLLKVSPASLLPGYRVKGTPLVIINRDPTDLDDAAEFVFHDSISKVFQKALE